MSQKLPFTDTLTMYFDFNHKLEDIHCGRCLHYEARKCKGKGYNCYEALECIKEIAGISEDEYFDCLENNYGINRAQQTNNMLGANNKQRRFHYDYKGNRPN